MNLYVIGQLISNNKTIAYKIYDSDSGESKLIATRDIMKAMEKHTEIHGLYHRINSKGYNTLVLNKNIPNIEKLDAIDSSGNLPSEQKAFILIGIKGFEENRVFHVIDANCQKYQFNTTDIKDKSIIGLSQLDNNIFIHTKYRNQIY